MKRMKKTVKKNRQKKNRLKRSRSADAGFPLTCLESVDAMADGLSEWVKKDPRRALLVIAGDENDCCFVTCKGSKLNIGVAIAASLEKERELIPILSRAVKTAKDYIMRTEMERP